MCQGHGKMILVLIHYMDTLRVYDNRNHFRKNIHELIPTLAVYQFLLQNNNNTHIILYELAKETIIFGGFKFGLRQPLLMLLT